MTPYINPLGFIDHHTRNGIRLLLTNPDDSRTLKVGTAEWMLNHTALLNKRKANWKHGGFDVNIEGQNRFELRGRSATLVGKPDLITQRDGQAVIVDVKTGEDSASHVVQWSSTDARL